MDLLLASPSSVTTGTYAVTVAATDTNSKLYGGGELDVSIDPMFYLDANVVTIKAVQVVAQVCRLWESFIYRP